MAKKSKDTGELIDHEVVTSLHHDGEAYTPGETVAVTAAQALALLAVGAVKAVKKVAGKPAAATEPKDGAASVEAGSLEVIPAGK